MDRGVGVSVDWPPALHVWPKGLALDYPRAEPQSLGMGQGGDGDGVGEAKNCWTPCQSARGWVLVALPG